MPIMLKASVNAELADQLGLKLNKYLPEKALVIASCDFAHHVDKRLAEAYDKVSVEVLEKFDLENVYNIEVDSPASIYTMLAYLKQKEAEEFTLVENTNAAIILEMPDYDDVTSYIFGYYTK